MIYVDGFSSSLQLLFLVLGLIAIAQAYDYLRWRAIARGEYYALLLFSLSGMMLMASAGDLIVVFVSLELLSIPLYVMAGFARQGCRFRGIGHEVLLAGRLCLRFCGLWHCVDLRCHRHDPAGRRFFEYARG